MRLDAHLVSIGLARSRDHAKELVAAGHVRINGQTARKASERIGADDDISRDGSASDYVSRAAGKLIAGLDGFGVSPEGRICADIGSSTGGFTEVLLRRGAELVFAIDVGRDQCHPRIAADPRVRLHEGTNARDLDPSVVTDAPSLVVSDVSFISITKALPPVLRLTAPEADLVTLVKPQFELGPDAIGKGGQVRPPLDEQEAFIRDNIIPALEESGFVFRDMILSPLKGGEGTTEFLLHAQKTSS
jgi:23S rRNA (cytidine1920-2'-O)/16S rRNA (cytidine1409-2'-O)-methyltransferase